MNQTVLSDNVSSTKRIYFISGLGADKRVFAKLMFPVDYELIYIDWIVPLADESLEGYAARLAENLDDSSPYYLIGLSFGGMLAAEIAKKFSPLRTFIISSIPVYTHLPWYYKLAGRLRLYKLMAVQFAKRTSPLMHRLFGVKNNSEKVMLNQIIQDTDPQFLKWAISGIFKWKNIVKPANLTHIHGSSDRILPVKFTRPDMVVEDAGHMMVYTHAGEISKLILEIIQPTNQRSN